MLCLNAGRRRQFQPGHGRRLTTEEIIDDGISRTVGVYQPVREGEPGVHRLPVVGVLKRPEDSAGEHNRRQRHSESSPAADF